MPEGNSDDGSFLLSPFGEGSSSSSSELHKSTTEGLGTHCVGADFFSATRVSETERVPAGPLGCPWTEVALVAFWPKRKE